MSSTDIWTYQDLVEHLLDMFDDPRTGRPLRMARRSAVEALRELSTLHRWLYYDDTRLIQTDAAYSTGTVTYTHTGGAYENLLELAGGTWPDYTRYGRIILANVHYPVAAVVDSTKVLLSPNENPGSNLAAGTAYTLYRNTYPLPVGFVELGQLYDLEDSIQINVVNTDIQNREAILWFDTPDDPWMACIRNDGEFLNSLSLVFVPAPSTAKRYQFTYHRSPRPLVTEKYSTGTVSATADSTTCTISTGAFASAHLGCILRFGTVSYEPDNIFGGISDTDNPFAEQRTIVAVSSDGTACTLDEAVGSTYESVKYTISDPIDVEHTAMLTALQRLAEAAYSRFTKREMKERRDREELALAAVRLAKERDSRAPYLSGVHYYYYSPFDRVNVTDDV